MLNKFPKVKYFYDSGLWSKDRVRDAVAKNWITAGQYEEITEEKYEEE
ncbi:MAG: XkdX family protein [Clostridia bacterium]|nr:XkdX family protein [Clostridia bacterium]